MSSIISYDFDGDGHFDESHATIITRDNKGNILTSQTLHDFDGDGILDFVEDMSTTTYSSHRLKRLTQICSSIEARFVGPRSFLSANVTAHSEVLVQYNLHDVANWSVTVGSGEGIKLRSTIHATTKSKLEGPTLNPV